MPSKVVYGKKRKKSILALFPVLRDDSNSLNSPKHKAEKRASTTISMTAFYGKRNSDSNQQDTLALDDSIEEMTSILIDDTTVNQLKGETGKRLSKLGSAKILSKNSGEGFFHEKALPRLPRLSFDSENDWNAASRPTFASMEAAFNARDLINGEDELDSFPPPVSRQPAHIRKNSTPLLPRKSSKRRSRQREQKDPSKIENNTNDNSHSIEPQKLSKKPLVSSSKSVCMPDTKGTMDAGQQIEAMLAASKALKPDGNTLETDSPEPSKKNGKRVFSKIKTAIIEQLNDRSLQKHHGAGKDKCLLNPNRSQLSDYDEEVSAISALEIRLNEGINFGNPKIKSLTGHGTIRRKPIADDGRSLLSRNSAEVFSPEEIHDRGGRSFASFDGRRRSNVSFDRSSEITPSLPSRSQRPKSEFRRSSGARRVTQGLEVDFDSVFSSSPIAQSTPRIRLEPMFEENGDTKLRNVPADSRSLFDPDNSIREPISDLVEHTTLSQKTTPRKLIVKRGNSQTKDVGVGVKSHLSKRRKKHPSPSKDELEDLEDALAHYSPQLLSIDAKRQEELTLSFGKLRTGDTLKSKDKNATFSQAAKRGKIGSQLGIFGKPKQVAASSYMAEPARRPALKAPKPSMIPKPAGAPTMKRRTEFYRFQRLSQMDESAMDTDELQWESAEYHLRVRH